MGGREEEEEASAIDCELMRTCSCLNAPRVGEVGAEGRRGVLDWRTKGDWDMLLLVTSVSRRVLSCAPPAALALGVVLVGGSGGGRGILGRETLHPWDEGAKAGRH